MPGEDTHALRAQLAVALKERDTAQAQEVYWHNRATEARDEARRLRGVLVLYAHCRHACVECFCVKEARAALCTGGDRG